MKIIRLIPIISIIALILLGAGGYFFCWPKYQEFKQQGTLLEEKNRALEEKNNYYLKLETLSNRIDAYKEELDKINSALPAEPSLPVLFDFMQKTSMENGLILGDISSSKGAISSLRSGGNTGIEKVSLSIFLSGSYSAFKNFLSAIYKNSRLIEVDSVSFSSPTEGELFDFNLSLETYVFPKKEVEKAGTIPGENLPGM